MFLLGKQIDEFPFFEGFNIAQFIKLQQDNKMGEYKNSNHHNTDLRE